MRVAYVRVSTEEQNEARQIEALKKHSIEKWFTEKISGKSMDRPQLQTMLDYVREGDTVYIQNNLTHCLFAGTSFCWSDIKNTKQFRFQILLQHRFIEVFCNVG